MQHPRQVFSREQLLEQVWGYQFYGDERTVDVHIKRLRQKSPPKQSHFCTPSGVLVTNLMKRNEANEI